MRGVWATYALVTLFLPAGAAPALEFAGEFRRMVALFPVYKAVVSQSLMRPYRNMFRDIGREKGGLRARGSGQPRKLRR
jgi:hypothetical protein